MTRTVSITQALEALPMFVEKAGKTKYFITFKGSSRAVLMSMDEYESLQETLDILSDKKLMRDIKKAEKEIAEGKTILWEDAKKELGFE